MAIRGPLHPPEGAGGSGGLSEAEVQTLIDDSIVVHEAAGDPHPQYLTAEEATTIDGTEVPVFAFFA